MQPAEFIPLAEGRTDHSNRRMGNPGGMPNRRYLA
jgi:hypothetical protein